MGLRNLTSWSAATNCFLSSSNEMKRHISDIGGELLANVGRFTSEITLLLRTLGATMYKGIYKFGCIVIRSDMRSRPEKIDVVLSISNAA